MHDPCEDTFVSILFPATPAPYHPAEIESANGELVVDIEW